MFEKSFPMLLRSLSGRGSKRRSRRRQGARDNIAAEVLEPREVLSGNGLTVVLDPGHGIGNAAGGVTGIESGITERELTLDMARRIQTDLRDWGFNVTLTRNNDYDVDFGVRSHTAQQVGADFFLSLHFDGRSDGSRGTIAEVMQTNVNLAEDVAFANLVRTATLRSYSQPSDGRTRITDERTGVLNDAALGNTAANHPVVSTLLEIEALSNRDVDRFFNNANFGIRDANRNLVAYNIAHGILEAKQAMFDNARVTAPSSLQATAVSSSQVNLSWADAANETGYRVYRWDGAKWGVAGTTERNATTFQVSGLPAGQMQWFIVEAYNANSSAWGDWRSVTTPNNRVNAPSWLNLNAVSSSQVNVSWADVSDEVGYRVYRGDGALVATVGANTTTYPLTGLSAGQTQVIRVEAFNAVNSASTGWQTVTTLSNRVNAPSWLNLNAVSSSQVNVSWADVSDENGYRIYRGDGALIATVGANTTTYPLTGLAAGQTQVIRVEAFNSVNSASTGFQTVTTPSNRVTAPAWLSVSAGGGSRANLYWPDVANETGYRIYHWENGRAVVIGTVGPNTTFFQTGPLARNQYHGLLVEAFNATSSAFTNWQSVWIY